MKHNHYYLGNFYYTGFSGWLNDTTLNISYFYQNLSLSWPVAEAYCRNMGAILPIFRSQTEITAFQKIL